MFKSWKTTAAGIGAALASLFGNLSAVFDSDPGTAADWNVTVALFVAAVGLIAARDNGVTSEKAGAKK